MAEMLKLMFKLKKFFAVLLILFVSSRCGAANYPETLSKSEAQTRARLSFIVNSVEGNAYDVYIIGYNEKVRQKWVYEGVLGGEYFAYISPTAETKVTIQNDRLFAGLRGDDSAEGSINLHVENDEGVYVAPGKSGLPDLLCSKIRMTGGGGFLDKVFVIKNGLIRNVRFMSDNTPLFICWT